MNIFITGYGINSAIGLNVEETYQSLVALKTGIKKGKKSHLQEYFTGEIELSDLELSDRCQVSKNHSRTALLGVMAAKEAFLGHEIRYDIRTGLISGTSVGGMDLSEIEYKNYLTNQTHRVQTYSNHPNGTAAFTIAKELGIQDFVNTISTACSSSANSIMAGARLIRAGVLDRVVAGGADALTLFTISGFKSLMIYDHQWCRPFDQTRRGLNLGEGAGFVVLESEASLKKSNQKPLVALTGWSNASDAFHQTASSPEGKGATLSMLNALKKAKLKPAQINYINAHGTATPNNDLSEAQAFKNVFKEKLPPFSSTKSYTGHTLAAAGSIEAVISVLSLLNGILFPNLNHHQKMEETGLVPLKELTKKTGIRHILSNSFGFSGNNTTLIFSTC